MDGLIMLYIAIAMVAVVAVYACMRWIDFGFTKAEDKRRYKMAKGYTRFYVNEQKQMAMSLTKKLNHNLFDMIKGYEDS